MSPNYLLYYLFGQNKIYKSELICSLLSLKTVANQSSLSRIKVIIYSDHTFILPDRLNFLEISFITIEKHVVETWMNFANDHFFIVKPMVLLDFQKRFDAPCLLIDTDTFFIKDPAIIFKKIAKGAFAIHGDEFPLVMDTEVTDFFFRKTFNDLEGYSFQINSNFYMLNCGVIGFHPDNSCILKKVINLISQIAGEKDWPADWSRLIEQISFSYYIQNSKFKKISTDRSIIHYWYFKESRHILANKFKYFYDQEEAVVIKGISRVRYDLLPTYIIQTMSKKSMIGPLHFKCFPPHTFIGRLLRNNAA